MQRTVQQLRQDAQRIWWAGVRAVQPQQLIPEHVAVAGRTLRLGEQEIDLSAIDRIAIVGAGKAGTAMTLALEAALGEELLAQKQVTGWVNIPADCVPENRVPDGCDEPAQRVRLHAARPAGVNEPRPEGVLGTTEILHLIGQLGPRDLCLCLISGGGSALLPAPIDGLTLASKIALTREISARGGTIEQLNTVRRELSTIKGGGLARACRAGQLVSLILSDVLGDDLEMIASGPTVMRLPTPQLALQVLDDLQLTDHPAGRDATALLRRQVEQPAQHGAGADLSYPRQVHNMLIGSNATAVDAAGIEAERLGYSHAMISATQSEGTAESVGAHLVEMAKSMRSRGKSPSGADGESGPDCLISGGEPTVQLTAEPGRGKGGRNQQLVLAALALLKDWSGLALLSGGTDGEDGPTDAAGALIDQPIADAARAKQIDLADYLQRNDAYHCFEQIDGLLKTGPTGTNVCDLRVLVVSKEQGSVNQDDG
jgi:glycerate 2-kinase